MSSMNGFHQKTPNSARAKGARNKFFREDKERKQAEAVARQAVSDSRSPEERLKTLDQSFGVGVGATKERAKLAARIASKNSPKFAKGPHQISEADAKLLSKPPAPLKIAFPVNVEESFKPLKADRLNKQSKNASGRRG